MGIMNWLGKKDESQTKKNAKEKQAVSEMRDRMTELVSKLQNAEASFAVHSSQFSEQDAGKIQNLFDGAIREAKNSRLTEFDTKEIDTSAISAAEILTQALDSVGSANTIKYCFLAIKYALLGGHAEIISTNDQEDTLQNRRETMERYVQIASLSFDVDKMMNEKDRRTQDQEKYGRDQTGAHEELQEMQTEDPVNWTKIKTLVAKPESELNGSQNIMVAATNRVLALRDTMNINEYVIGELAKQIGSRKDIMEKLRVQLSEMETALNAGQLKRIDELTDSFVRNLVKNKEMTRQLEDLSHTFTGEVEATLGGQDAKIEAIKVSMEYEKLLKELDKKSNEAEAAAMKIRAEREKRKRAEERLTQATENLREEIQTQQAEMKNEESENEQEPLSWDSV